MPEMPSPTSESTASVPERAMRAFEMFTGLTVCLHDRAGLFYSYLSPDRFQHTSQACRSVKAAGGEIRCQGYDRRQVHDDLSSPDSARMQRCHAGLIEWVCPIHQGDELMGVLFAGQRRLPANAQPPATDPQWTGSPTVALSIDRVPLLDLDSTDEVLELLRQLGARLSHWLEQRMNLPKAPRSRAEQIYTFIQEHHTQTVRLSDLAAALHLSPARTSHAVRETTGRSFQSLLTDARIATAAALLAHSDLTVAAVAHHAGFTNLARFHRAFKLAVGSTPGAYRQMSA